MSDSAPFTIRAAAVVLAFYGFLVAANAAFYVPWFGVPADLPRLVVRLVGVAIMVYGLWTSLRWARWVALAFSAVFGVSGLFALWAASQTGAFEGRPYPTLDYIVFVVSSLVLLAAATLLVLPARKAGRFAEPQRT